MDGQQPPVLDPSPDDDSKFITSMSMTDQSRRSVMSAGRDSRKMILNSYEQAGVDLPLTQLETILDREVLVDSFGARQSGGGPRFRKLLGRASSAINQRKDKDPIMVPDDESIGDINGDDDDDKFNDDKFDDDEFDDELVCNAAKNSDNNSAVTPDTRTEGQTQPMMPVSNYIDVPKTTTTKMNDTYAQGQGQIPVSAGTGTSATNATTTTPITPATPSSYSHGAGTAPFDLCCPESTSSQKKDNKYVVSNLQLAEGFDDEYHGHHAIGNGRSFALMDLEESMVDTTFTVEKSTTNHERNKHHPGKGKHGMISHFRGSRRFRISLIICCLLHLILVSLIITFVMTMDNDTVTNGYEADASITTPDQATTSSSPNTTDMIASMDLVTSNTLFPDDQQIDDPPAVTTSATAEKVSSTQDSTTVIDQEVSTEVVNDPSLSTVNSTAAVAAAESEREPESESCVDKLELSLNCFGRDSEVLVFFQSCTPQPGDWVAIYDISHDPENLLDSDSIAWLYTCGNRRCNEPIQNEVLPFSRVAERVPAGRYRAYLIRNGRGPFYSSFASSPDFQVAECQEL